MRRFVRRADFLVATGAFAALPRAARATGGLDTEAETGATIRVLLASGAFEPPRPLDAWRFSWNGRVYRGTAATVTLPDGRAGLVNALALDAYLYGVLGSEISASWSPAAQQAQAIASRTYVLAKIRPEKPFDVSATVGDQEYGGVANESVECRAAIDATAGQIVTYGGSPAHVAYSSCCGGCTADAGDVWKTPYPYLVPVVDPNCNAAPNYTWSAAIVRGDVEAALGSRLAGVGRLRDVRLDRSARDERPRRIVFAGTSSSVEMAPADVRGALGPARVRSTFIRSAELGPGGDLVLAGTGRGHGVGLCQWGARALAEGGAPVADILGFYFPGTGLGRA